MKLMSLCRWLCPTPTFLSVYIRSFGMQVFCKVLHRDRHGLAGKHCESQRGTKASQTICDGRQAFAETLLGTLVTFTLKSSERQVKFFQCPLDLGNVVSPEDGPVVLVQGAPKRLHLFHQRAQPKLRRLGLFNLGYDFLESWIGRLRRRGRGREYGGNNYGES